MKQEQWKALTIAQKTEVLDARTKVHESDILEQRRETQGMLNHLDELTEYVRMLDNRVDALALVIQELVHVLKKNKQITDDDAQHMTNVNQ